MLTIGLNQGVFRPPPRTQHRCVSCTEMGSSPSRRFPRNPRERLWGVVLGAMGTPPRRALKAPVLVLEAELVARVTPPKRPPTGPLRRVVLKARGAGWRTVPKDCSPAGSTRVMPPKLGL